MSTFPINDEQYLLDRLEDQYQWFEKKAAWNQRYYKRLRMTEILAAALVPVLSTISVDKLLPVGWAMSLFQLLVPLLGIAIAVIAGAMSLYKFHENWIQYRTTAEQLRHERFLYVTQCGPYAGPNRFSILVQRVENLLMKENTTWARAETSQGDADGKPPAAHDGKDTKAAPPPADPA